MIENIVAGLVESVSGHHVKCAERFMIEMKLCLGDAWKTVTGSLHNTTKQW